MCFSSMYNKYFDDEKVKKITKVLFSHRCHSMSDQKTSVIIIWNKHQLIPKFSRSNVLFYSWHHKPKRSNANVTLMLEMSSFELNDKTFICTRLWSRW